mgnify:CR=1 FL=1|tara:strand:+ start:321 stop:710 length:390 start_codon:yes stop_codon:yes gene_type:complete
MASVLKVDEMQGVTSAGDITITGEGTATMRLQQGVAKMWVAAETDAQPFDSFNTASGTDNGTGDYTYAFTNVMTNDDYSITSGCSYAAILSFDHPERTTSNYNVRIFARTDSLTNDNAKNNQAIHGDLA